MAINFLAVGHITHDRVPEGFRLGGTVTFAAVTARRLGWRPAIITRATPEGLQNGVRRPEMSRLAVPERGVLAGVPVCLLPSSTSTTFVNIYRNGRRVQVIESWAEPVLPEALPLEWADVPVVLLGPIAREVPESWTSTFPASALLGVTPQGWMRQWDGEGHVRPALWESAGKFLSRADAVILSREDVGGDEAYLNDLAKQCRLLVATDGWHGATVYLGGNSYPVPPRPTSEVDPTGAGDVFATAFLIRLAETSDPLLAARFANIAASMSVEAAGMEAIPFRAQVDAWLAQHG